MWIIEALNNLNATVLYLLSGLATYNKPDKTTRVSSSKSFLKIVTILRKVSQTILKLLF